MLYLSQWAHPTDLHFPTAPDNYQLDPFAGSGTTVLAAVEEGYEAVGIEVTDTYYALGTERVRSALETEKEGEKKPNETED